MNVERPIQNKERKETGINIGEVYFDTGLEDFFNKETFVSEIQDINKGIEEYLGKNKATSEYDFRIYSDRREYEEYFRSHFPEKSDFMKNDMVFYYDEKNNRNIIAKFMERTTLNPNDPKVREYMKRENITFDELNSQLKQNYRSNVYPTMAHELTHSHSFFKGVHYRTSGNKWAQEMVCVFIDQKMWEKYVPNFREMTMKKATEQARDRDLYVEIVNDFKEGDFQIEEWERFFYQFLEERFEKEKLIRFWTILLELQQEANLEKCFESIFEETLKNVIVLFQEKFLATPSTIGNS